MPCGRWSDCRWSTRSFCRGRSRGFTAAAEEDFPRARGNVGGARLRQGTSGTFPPATSWVAPRRCGPANQKLRYAELAGAPRTVEPLRHELGTRLTWRRVAHEPKTNKYASLRIIKRSRNSSSASWELHVVARTAVCIVGATPAIFGAAVTPVKRTRSPNRKKPAVAWRRQRRDAGHPNKKAPYADEYSTSTASATSTLAWRGARLGRRLASR